jgi:hypothetical protein
MPDPEELPSPFASLFSSCLAPLASPNPPLSALDRSRNLQSLLCISQILVATTNAATLHAAVSEKRNVDKIKKNSKASFRFFFHDTRGTSFRFADALEPALNEKNQ